MKICSILLLCMTLLGACAGGSSHGKSASQGAACPPPAEPVEYDFTVVNSWDHSTRAYTQGLQYADGLMWEGTGLHGQSVVFTTDLATGKSRELARLPRSEFGEGITLLGDRLYQLTWQENTCHLYKVTDKGLEPLRDFRYTGEGWGLTTDGQRLYMSDGTETLTVRRADTFGVERRMTVTLNGEPIRFLNELEWIDGKIWANVYTTQQIVIIHPKSGVVEGIIDLTGILPEKEHTATTDVLNGIAYDKEQKRIFVTGKNWSKIFEIAITRR